MAGIDSMLGSWEIYLSNDSFQVGTDVTLAPGRGCVVGVDNAGVEQKVTRVDQFGSVTIELHREEPPLSGVVYLSMLPDGAYQGRALTQEAPSDLVAVDTVFYKRARSGAADQADVQTDQSVDGSTQ